MKLIIGYLEVFYLLKKLTIIVEYLCIEEVQTFFDPTFLLCELFFFFFF